MRNPVRRIDYTDQRQRSASHCCSKQKGRTVQDAERTSYAGRLSRQPQEIGSRLWGTKPLLRDPGSDWRTHRAEIGRGEWSESGQKAAPVTPGNVSVGAKYFWFYSPLFSQISGNVTKPIASWIGGLSVRARPPVSGSTGKQRSAWRVRSARPVPACIVLIAGMFLLPVHAQQIAAAPSTSAIAAAAATTSTNDAPPQFPLCTESPELVPVAIEIPEPPEINPVSQVAVAHKDDEDRGHEHAKHEGAKRAKYDVKRIGEREIGRGMNIYSLEREQALGRELAGEIESQSRMVADPVVTEYVNRIGQTLVRNSDARVPFTIKVVDNDEVNAFALPGGFFYVNTGLILAAENESELAGVMAHEIAHVAARHATKNATKAQIWNIASIPLIFMGGPAGYAIREVVSVAVPMSFLKFSRDAEREADLLGVEYEYAAGYDPVAFVQFFEKLHAREKEKHSFIAKAFTTHPMTADRIKRAQDEIATMLPAKDDYIVDTSEFEEVKARLSALVLRHEIEAGQGARPTLRRRGPDDNSNDKSGGPTLKKRTD